SGLLEESEARLSLSPGGRAPRWGNRQRRYEKSPTGQTVGGIRSKVEPFPQAAASAKGYRSHLAIMIHKPYFLNQHL
ncbi:MAG: hypothetical protein IJJ38_09100, partial [Lachnospiraceae bacterium]|nr:hypothetical protein [Lachnospiraceae bacterium]